MNVTTHDAIKKIVPWKLLNSSAEPICQWLYTGEKRFTEPFFDDTISVCRRLEENCKSYKSVSSLPMMDEWAEGLESVMPTAIIFHVSRCGSTLLSQLLALDESNIVLSEVPFFDELLRLPFKDNSFSSGKTTDLLKAAIKFYSQSKTGKEEHLFIKADSWHIHFYPLLRTLYPSVPFIFLYRNPWDVVLSQERQRGMHAVPGIIEPAVFGFSNEQVIDPDFNRYMTRVLEGYFYEMIGITKSDKLVFPVNYATGINAIFKKIYGLLNKEISTKVDEMLTERSRFHAKHPQQIFKEANKEANAPSYLAPALELYHQLDKSRLASFE
jgi:hypothetical protein